MTLISDGAWTASIRFEALRSEVGVQARTSERGQGLRHPQDERQLQSVGAFRVAGNSRPPRSKQHAERTIGRGTCGSVAKCPYFCSRTRLEHDLSAAPFA